MPDRRAIPSIPVFGAWLKATWLGWLLGIPMVVVLALLGEAMRIGGSQVLVGAGMGLGVGILQARALRGLLPSPATWWGTSIAGLSAPFLVHDVSRLSGWNIPYSLPVAVAVGGTLVGVLQSALLRKVVEAPALWVPASALGWSLAGGTSALADLLSRGRSLRGVPGALAFLAIAASGGAVLGAVTGGVWARSKARRTVDEPPRPVTTTASR